MTNFHILAHLSGTHSSTQQSSIEEYKPLRDSFEVHGLQDNYNALIWIRETGTPGKDYLICQKQCNVKFFYRRDNVLFVMYNDAVDQENVIFMQALYKETVQEDNNYLIRKDELAVHFRKAESLKTGKNYELSLRFEDKQKYDRACLWFAMGDPRPKPRLT